MFALLILTVRPPLNPLFMRELVTWFIGVFLAGAGRPGDPSLRRAVVVFLFCVRRFLDGQDSGMAIPAIPPASNATTILHADMDDDSVRAERGDSVHVEADDDDSAGADMDADDSACAAPARPFFR